MVMGYPMNSTRYTDEVYCYFNYRLKLLIFILKQLKILGYHTIYKGHPDRILELGDLMDDYVINVMTKNLSKFGMKLMLLYLLIVLLLHLVSLLLRLFL